MTATEKADADTTEAQHAVGISREQMWSVLDHFGLYQRRLFLLTILPLIVDGYQTMSVILTFASPQHRCRVPGMENDTFSIQSEAHRMIVNLSIPMTSSDGDVSYSECDVYKDRDGIHANKTVYDVTKPCDSWVYDVTDFDETMVTQFDLVCERKGFRATFNMVHLVGMLVGCPVMGILCDRWGRKVVLVVSMMLTITLSIVAAFPVVKPMLVVYRFVIGVLAPGLYFSLYVLCLEFMGSEHRTIAGSLMMVLWVLGPLLVGALSYAFRDWRWLQILNGAPFIFCISYWWLIDESPRWLLAEGRVQEAQKIILKVMKVNKISVPDDKSTVPDDKIAVPDDKITVPDDKSTVLTGKITVPADKSTVPADKITVPADKSTVPDDKITVPADSPLGVDDTLNKEDIHPNNAPTVANTGDQDSHRGHTDMMAAVEKKKNAETDKENKAKTESQNTDRENREETDQENKAHVQSTDREIREETDKENKTHAQSTDRENRDDTDKENKAQTDAQSTDRENRDDTDKENKAQTDAQNTDRENRAQADKELQAKMDAQCTDHTDRKKTDKEAEEAPQESVLKLFKYPNLIVRTGIIFFNWAAVSTTYFGLSLNVSNLDGDIRLNFLFSNLVEVMGYAITWVALDRLGRKRTHCAAMLLSGTSCLATIFSVLFGGPDLQWVTIGLVMVGKLGISAAYSTIFLMSGELFPTVFRNRGLNWSATVGGVATLLSPYIADLSLYMGGSIGKILPLVIFGAFALTAGLLALHLPETLHRKLPDTILEAANYTKKQSSNDVNVQEKTETSK